MTPTLEMSRLTLVAQGRQRLIYQHPDAPDRLVKVLRPEARANLPGAATCSAWQARRRFGPYALFAREVAEFLACHARDPASLAFTQRILGFTDTDMGLGIIVEAARDRSGHLAPTIDGLIQRGSFGPPEQLALQRFFQALLASPVVVSDLHWRNLVYAHCATHGDHFVIIDGLGSANFLPLKSWFPAVNRRSKMARIRRVKNKLASLLGASQLIPQLLP